jgi:hypothetical protein
LRERSKARGINLGFPAARDQGNALTPECQKELVSAYVVTLRNFEVGLFAGALINLGDEIRCIRFRMKIVPGLG